MSHHFIHGIDPIAGAHEHLTELKEHFELHVVTARPHNIRDQTIDWINKHYDGLFSEFHFGNLYGASGVKKKKSQICSEIGAVGLVDDSAGYAMDCATNGIPVILFGEYAWNNTVEEDHELVSRAKCWKEVKHLALSMLK